MHFYFDNNQTSNVKSTVAVLELTIVRARETPARDYVGIFPQQWKQSETRKQECIIRNGKVSIF